MNALSSKRILWALMVTIGIDTMGFLLIFPLFPLLFSPHTHLLVSEQASALEHLFFYAAALALWPLGNFFGTAFLGDLSDSIGRKKILILGLFMVFVSYALQGVSVYFHSIYLFLFARALQGFFGGNYDIAQAAIADISTKDNKVRNMALISLASSLGVVIGPIFSALLVPASGASLFAIALPFWLAAGIAFANCVWIFSVYQNTYVPKTKRPIHLLKVFSAFLFVFQDQRVRLLGMIYFLMMIGWGLYIQQIPLVMQNLFHYNPHQLGYFLFVLGVGFVLAVQWVQPRLIKRYAAQKIYTAFMFILTVLLFLAGVYPKISIEWMAVFFNALFLITAYGCLLAMLSDAVSKDEQGRVMGGIGAIASLAFAATAISLFELTTVNLLLPILLASFVYCVSGLLMLRHRYSAE